MTPQTVFTLFALSVSLMLILVMLAILSKNAVFIVFGIVSAIAVGIFVDRIILIETRGDY